MTATALAIHEAALPAPARVAARREGGLASALLGGWHRARVLADSAILSAAIVDGSPTKIARVLVAAVSGAGVVVAAERPIRGAFLDGAHIEVETLRLPVKPTLAPAGKAPRAGVSFDAVNRAAVEWAEGHAGALVVGQVEVQEIVGALIVESQRLQVPVRELQRRILGVIGLDPRRARAVEAFAERLRAAGISPRDVSRRTERYAAAQLRSRALAIARTETNAALAGGQQALWDQAVTDGLLSPAVMEKVWIVTPDDLLCDECEALDGEAVEIDETFSVGYQGPPAHTNCRCSVGLKRKDRDAGNQGA